MSSGCRLVRLPATMFAIVLVCLWAGQAQAATTGFNQTTSGPWDYNATGNWASNIINGVWDSSLTLTSGQTVYFNQDTVLNTGLSFRYSGANNITLRGITLNRLVTLGGDIVLSPVTDGRIVALGSVTNTQYMDIDLGLASRTVTISGTNRMIVYNTIASSAGPYGIIKNGTGTLQLNGASHYTGPTTINSGRVLVNGSLGNTAVSVNSTGTLGGTGTIGGLTTLHSGGHLSPGASGVEDITLAGGLIVNGGAVLDCEFASTASYDQVRVSGGTLTISATAANKAVFSLTNTTTGAAWSADATYQLIQYTGSIAGLGTASLNSVLGVANMQAGKRYVFDAAGGWVTLTIAPGYSPAVLPVHADNTGTGSFGQPGATMQVTQGLTQYALAGWGASVDAYSPADGSGDPAHSANSGRAVFLAGRSTADPTLSWRTREAGELYPGDTTLISDVVQIAGLVLGGGKYALQMRYDDLDEAIGDNEDILAAAGRIYPVYLATGGWTRLGTLDSLKSVAPTDATLSSFAAGDWGIDKAANTVWVVLDSNGTFAVVPEPGTIALLALAGASAVGAVLRRRPDSRTGDDGVPGDGRHRSDRRRDPSPSHCVS